MFGDKIFYALITLLVGTVLAIGLLTNMRANRNRELRENAAVLRAEAKQTDIDIDMFRLQVSQDSTTIVTLRKDIARLKEEADVAETSTLEALALRESARNEVREDTLSPALRALLTAERAVAISFRRELLVARARITKLDSILTFETGRADAAVSLLWGVQLERDTALDIISAHEKRWDLSLSRLLFRDLPRKAACAGGGAAVAAMNKGDVLVGAGVGLLACLMMESIL